MSTPEELARQAAAVARVRLARTGRDHAERELREAIIAAYRSGAHVRDIALAAEMTRQRVHQIIRER